MTTLSKDEILAMAREAGAVFDPRWGVASNIGTATFERFAALCRAPLVAEVELPAPTARFNWNLGKFEWLVTFKHSEHHLKPLYTRDQLLAYGAAQRLAGREQAIEDCATAAWTHYMDTAKRKGIGPDVMPEWIACKAIRALAASLQEQT